MMQNKIRRVVEVNREEQLAGVISLGDLTAHTTTATSGEVLREVSRFNE